jgi:hypothetical protein
MFDFYKKDRDFIVKVLFVLITIVVSVIIILNSIKDHPFY